jgi:fumarate reductase flavoprotein subunit
MRETGDLPAQADVLVLGAGMAGHCAAITAAEAGAQVLLLEKTAQAGGSSAIAGGGFVFAGTNLQREAGISDSLEALRRDLLESGRNKNNPALVDLYVQTQLETYEFLCEHGVKFRLSPALPGAIPRVHITGTGRAITALHMAALANPRIAFFSKTSAHRLHRSLKTGRVDRALVVFGDREAEIAVTGGVVLSTGGFSRSRELLQTFAPELAGGLKHGGVGNTGDGLIMATDLGAGLADIGFVTGSFGGAIRNYPNTVQKGDEIAPLLFSFLVGGILVNKTGVRFANEGQSYKSLSTVGMEQPEGIGFQIFDQKLMDRSGNDTTVNNFRDGLIGGYIQSANTIPELARKMAIDPTVLQSTVERYNKDAKDGVDTQFGRTETIVPIDTPPFYIAASANAITSTYGGITANADMSVVDWFGQPIEGLFAAGEVVGGFHGAGYYSASSLSSSAAFGRRAGRSAAALSKA